MDGQQISKNLKNTNQWIRVLFMILFWVILYITYMVLGLVVVVQMLFALITGKPNFNVRKLSAGVSAYIKQMVDFLTYNTEEKPFPFESWPEVEVVDDEPVEESASATEQEETLQAQASESDKGETADAESSKEGLSDAAPEANAEASKS